MKYVRIMAIVMMALLTSTLVVRAAPDAGSLRPYCEVIAPDGTQLFTTGLRVAVGNRFLSSDNVLYTITHLDGDRAFTRNDGPDPAVINQSPNGEVSVDVLLRAEVPQPSLVRKGKVGIYHTHTWESYIPSDGQSLIQGKGGIFDVGDAMAAGFKDRGVQVERSPDIQRDYDSSRRTALQLLQDGSDTLVDVHRNTAPASTYEVKVNGQPATKALIVVGQENPNMAPNKAFAYDLKARSDAIFPGLVRGIFFGNGIYNQDLWPRSILIEFGSASSVKEEAERGAYAMAGVITDLLYPPLPAGPTQPSQPTPLQSVGAPSKKAIWQTVLGWTSLLIILTGAYLLINEPNWEAVKQRLIRFARVEFANYLGRMRRK